MKLNQDNKKEIMTLGVPVLGLTYNTNQKKAVVADYFNPEFIIYNVTEEPLQFNLDRVIGNDLSVPYDGGEHKNLWNKIAQSHTHPRAQEAKLVRSKLFYLQNGGLI